MRLEGWVVGIILGSFYGILVLILGYTKFIKKREIRLEGWLFGFILGALYGIPILTFGYPKGAWPGVALMFLGGWVMRLIRRRQQRSDSA